MKLSFNPFTLRKQVKHLAAQSAQRAFEIERLKSEHLKEMQISLVCENELRDKIAELLDRIKQLEKCGKKSQRKPQKKGARQ